MGAARSRHAVQRSCRWEPDSVTELTKLADEDKQEGRSIHTILAAPSGLVGAQPLHVAAEHGHEDVVKVRPAGHASGEALQRVWACQMQGHLLQARDISAAPPLHTSARRDSMAPGAST